MSEDLPFPPKRTGTNIVNPKRFALNAGIPAVALIVGLAVGGGIPRAADTSVATPVPTVTRTRPITPSACYDALDKAERVISDTQRAFQIIGGSIGGSEATIIAATGELNALAKTISDDRQAYDAAASACRSS